MGISEVLDKAYEDQVTKMYGIFVDSVASASNTESELVAAAERFRKGIAILKRVLIRAKEVSAA